MSLKSNAYKCMFYEREWTNMTALHVVDHVYIQWMIKQIDTSSTPLINLLVFVES